MMWNSQFDVQLGILSISEVGFHSYHVNFFIYNWTDNNCPPASQLTRIWKLIFTHCEYEVIDSIGDYLSYFSKSYTKALKSFDRYKERSYK